MPWNEAIRASGSKSTRRQMLANGSGDRLDIGGVLVVGRRDPDGGLPAQRHEGTEGLVAGRGLLAPAYCG